MIPKEIQKAMQAEEKFFGINSGFKLYSPYPFAGMNQKSTSRQDGKDQELWFIENFIKTGEGCLRTLYDQGAPLYTAPNGKTIIYYFFYNLGATNYVAIFLSDGTAIQVNTATGANTTISSVANTFYSSGVSVQIPVGGQWGTTYLLVANNFAANNYWVWDGSVLYTAGTLSPLITITDGGANYTSAPTITAYGGLGTGATFVGTILNGSVVNIQETNPGIGYEPGDIVQLYITGGGSDSNAELTAVLSAGSVQSVIITNPGSGYTPGVGYALGFSGGGGTGATGTYVVANDGTVIGTNVTAGGTGYTGTPSVSFPSGGGTGATGIATITPGTVASITVVHGGSGFTGTPALTFVGGSGSGAVASANLSGGVISSVTVTNHGSGYTSAPAVVVQSGLNNAASATLTLMPYGISGTAIETFSQRVWISFPYQSSTGNTAQKNGGLFNVSAPGSFSDFSTSDGGLQFTNTDAFLRSQYVNLKQSNGYLYPLGDSSVSVISNVQTVGSPSSTTFNYQNTDPQIGATWRDTVTPYSRTILFANPFGVFGLYGGAVTKISQNMDSVFNNAVFPAAGGVVPTTAVANIYNSKVFLINITITDPFTKQSRTVMLAWDEREWFIASQKSSLTFIATQEIDSDLTAWGTDGTNLFQLFETPSATLSKKISSKLYGQNNFLIQKESMGVYAQMQDLSTDQSGAAIFSLTIDSETGAYEVPIIPPFADGVPPFYPVNSIGSGDVYGVNLGFTLTTLSKDSTFTFLGCGYVETGSIAMGNNPITGTVSTE